MNLPFEVSAKPIARLKLIHDALACCGFVKQKPLPGTVLGNMYLARLSDNDLAIAVVGDSYAVLPIAECEKLVTLLSIANETRGLEITAIYRLTQPHQYVVTVAKASTFFVNVDLAYTRKIPDTYQTCHGDWLLKFSGNHLIFQSAITVERKKVSVRHSECVDFVWTPDNVTGVMRATITNCNMLPEWRDVAFAFSGDRCDVEKVFEILNDGTQTEIFALLEQPQDIVLNEVVQTVVDFLGDFLLSGVMPINAGWVIHVDEEFFREGHLEQDEDVIVFVTEDAVYVIVIDDVKEVVETVVYNKRCLVPYCSNYSAVTK
jgi:hypothetical protein